jgi:hypothetical protein
VERTTIAGETEVLGENLPQRHFVPPQIPHDQVWFRTPGRSGGKPATNRLSYGAAFTFIVTAVSNSNTAQKQIHLTNDKKKISTTQLLIQNVSSVSLTVQSHFHIFI